LSLKSRFDSRFFAVPRLHRREPHDQGHPRGLSIAPHLAIRIVHSSSYHALNLTVAGDRSPLLPRRRRPPDRLSGGPSLEYHQTRLRRPNSKLKNVVRCLADCRRSRRTPIVCRWATFRKPFSFQSSPPVRTLSMLTVARLHDRLFPE